MRLKKQNGKIIHVAGACEGSAKKQDVLFNTAPDAHYKAHRDEFFEGLDGADITLINKHFWR